MIVWSTNYPTYIPAPPMLCNTNSSRFQLLPAYAHRSPDVFFDSHSYSYNYYNYNYYDSPSTNNNFADSNSRVPIRTHRFRDDHPHHAPHPLQVRPRRPTPLPAPHRNRNSIGFRDARTSCGQPPLQVSKLRNTTRIRGLPHRKTTKGRRHFRRIPLQLSNLPTTTRIRNPFKRRITHAHSSRQLSGFHKRPHTQFRASPLKKRKTQTRAPTESSLRVSGFRKRSHRFTKCFPLRVSNQWRKTRRTSYACLRCKKQGHLAIRCPQNMINNNSSLSLSIGQHTLQYSPPSLICRCGLRCSLTTWKRTARKVYTCSLRRCKVFRWEDEVNKDELITVPKCGCGAGFCRQCTESGDTQVGRKYFACPIKKGQGACTFFKLLNDESLTNNRHVDERISPLRFTIGNCSDTFHANNVQKESRSHVLDTVEYYPNQREIAGNQKVELMEVELECEEDTSNKTPRKCNKRLRDGAPKYDSSFSHTVVEFINVAQSYSEGGDTDGVVHARKSMFLRQTSIVENALAVSSTSHSCSYTSGLFPLREEWLMTAAMDLNIELFKGWWGRLAYPPAPCLKLPEPKPIYCCVFPSFDPIFVPQSGAEVDWQSRNCQNPQKILEGSLMFGAISDRFARVARDLQNKLISLLKSSDFRAHDYMDREANITFTALDQLQVQSQPFCKRVNKFIRSASYLAKAESFIISNDQSNNDSKHHYNSKKRKRDDLISDYDVAKADMETCKEGLHSLCEEASRQKGMLFQVKSGVSSCEAENRYHEARCTQISIGLIELEKNIQVAEEDLRLLHQKKEEYNAAEAAYKKARIELGIIT